MRIISAILVILFTFNACRQKTTIQPSIVPLPQQMELRSGEFTIDAKTQIIVTDEELIPLANLIREYIKRLSGLELEIARENSGLGNISLNLVEGLKLEEYQLNILDGVLVNASNYNSMALGISTLIQCLSVSGKRVRIPNMSVTDKPDFSYRAVLVDVARMWHPVETLKETIDLLWMYKIPYLLLHLSDNRRFTFPLDEFPDLKTVKEDGSREYYTREELDDLVEYARQRGIIIIPEVELPGHSGQLFTKYPEVFGSVDKLTGKAKYMYVINMAKEEAYTASEKIINSLAEVFYTSPYIHIGCDEVYLEVLKTVPEYKTFCEKHGLSVALKGDANELFCYFINRLDEMVKSTGKSSIIWEGFHGTGAGSQTISKEIPVIVWNTTYNHPDSLLNNGYEIINSTWIPWYLVGAMNLAAPQEKGFDWDVTKWAHWNEKIPNVELESKDGIRGGQICYWEQNHYKVIPILKESVPVLSERLWNNANSDFKEFKNRYAQTNSLYEELFHPVKISEAKLLSQIDQTFTDNAEIKLESSIQGKIKYVYADSWNLPDMASASDYKTPITINKSGILTTQLFDAYGNKIGFAVQKYYQKIEPTYNYRVFRGAPQHGWESMPDFSELMVIREGVSGFMTPERLQKINNELFAKVKKEGHIEVRFNGIYNPYALELKGNINIPENDEYTFRIQTHDGLAELYIDNILVGKGQEFGNKAEDFDLSLEAGIHSITIKYFYKQIQNQLSILYKTSGMKEFRPFEERLIPLN